MYFLHTGAGLQPHRIDLYAANGQTTKTCDIPEHVRFKMCGYELEFNCVIVDDAYRLVDFFLGRNLLQTYSVLVNMNSMKKWCEPRLSPCGDKKRVMKHYNRGRHYRHCRRDRFALCVCCQSDKQGRESKVRHHSCNGRACPPVLPCSSPM